VCADLGLARDRFFHARNPPLVLFPVVCKLTSVDMGRLCRSENLEASSTRAGIVRALPDAATIHNHGFLYPACIFRKRCRIATETWLGCGGRGIRLPSNPADRSFGRSRG
jgi:hypothetical protein